MAISSTAGSSKASVLASLAGLHEANNARMVIDNSNFFIIVIVWEKSSEPLQ
jgi:ABC-type molybdate transport system ATPase subunit